MNVPKAIVIASVLLVFCASPIVAQDGPSLCTKIENAAANTSPKWKLERKPKRCDIVSTFKWTSGKSEVHAIMWPCPSVEDGVSYFQLLAKENGLLMETMNVLGTGLREVGDENRLWVTPTFRSKGIDFRKGKFVVRVTGSTMESALQFAVYISQALPAA